eukprot:8702149-Prorocentrum_lima.AAC.1
MTSSLVGSEMCIRDRCRVSKAPNREWKKTQSRYPHWHMGCRVIGRDAVSYTHLTLPTICSV